MLKTTKCVLVGITGASVALVMIGEQSHYSLIKYFNTSACDQQGLLKVLVERLPSNGTTSYNYKEGLCVYNYTKPDGHSGELSWKP